MQMYSWWRKIEDNIEEYQDWINMQGPEVNRFMTKE